MKVQLGSANGSYGGFLEFHSVVSEYAEVDVSREDLARDAGANDLIIWAADPAFWMTIGSWASEATLKIVEAIGDKVVDKAADFAVDVVFLGIITKYIKQKIEKNGSVSSKMNKKIQEIASTLEENNQGDAFYRDNSVQTIFSDGQPLERYKFQPEVELPGSSVNISTVALAALIMAGKQDAEFNAEVEKAARQLLMIEINRAIGKRHGNLH